MSCRVVAVFGAHDSSPRGSLVVIRGYHLEGVSRLGSEIARIVVIQLLCSAYPTLFELNSFSHFTIVNNLVFCNIGCSESNIETCTIKFICHLISYRII